jgi:hypothetical protein
MEMHEKPIAIVQGASSAVIQRLFGDLVERLRSEIRIAGMLEEGHGPKFKARDVGVLKSIVDGKSFPIFQNLGSGAKGCSVDPEGPATAAHAACVDLKNGCDLLVLSKFGKLESERQGLTAAFIAGLEAGIPILTYVAPQYAEQWEQFAAPFFVVLPGDLDVVESWCRSHVTRLL